MNRPEIVREKLAELIERMLPSAGPIVRTKIDRRAYSRIDRPDRRWQDNDHRQARRQFAA